MFHVRMSREREYLHTSVELCIQVESPRQKPTFEAHITVKNKWENIFFKRHMPWNLNLLAFSVLRKNMNYFGSNLI